MNDRADLQLAPAVRFGDFILDRARFELRRGGEPVRLQPKTFDVLSYLVENPGRVVRDDLVAAVWPGVIVTEHSLTRCIKDLRKALGDEAAHPRYIETVARRGYRFLAVPQPALDPRPFPAELALLRPEARDTGARRWLSTLTAALLIAAFALVAPRDAGMHRGTTDFDALQAFRVGYEAMHRRPEGWMNKALEAFDRAIGRDPRFADAHGGRAAVLAVQATGVVAPEAISAKAWASVQEALRLDADCALALMTMGFLRLERGDARGGESILRRAIALDPKLGNAYNWLSNSLNAQGRHAEAHSALLAGLRVDPLHPSMLANVGLHYERRGLYAEARASYTRMMLLPQRSRIAHSSLISVAVAEGRLAEALDIALRWESEAQGSQRTTARLEAAGVAARLGETSAASARLDQSLAEGLPPTRLLDIASTLRRLGRAREFDAIAARFAPVEPPPWFQASLMMSRVLGDDPASGIDTLTRLLAGYGVTPRFWTDERGTRDLRLGLAYGLHRVGRSAEARAELERVFADHRRIAADGLGRTPDEMALLALAYGMAGNRTEALRAFNDAVGRGWNDCFAVDHDPRWDVLRDDPGFREVLARARQSVAREHASVRQVLLAANSAQN